MQIEFFSSCVELLIRNHWLTVLAILVSLGILLDLLLIMVLTMFERDEVVISEIYRIEGAGNVWFYQIIEDSEETAYNLYDSCGDFVDEFLTMNEMFDFVRGNENCIY